MFDFGINICFHVSIVVKVYTLGTSLKKLMLGGIITFSARPYLRTCFLSLANA